MHYRVLLSTLTLLLLSNLAMALKVMVSKAGTACANGIYMQQSPSLIPAGFAKVCRKSRWNTEDMWAQLTNGKTPWYLKEDDDAYIYYNVGDNKWWIDAPEGHGLYTSVALNDDPFPPSRGYEELGGADLPLPEVVSIDSNEM